MKFSRTLDGNIFGALRSHHLTSGGKLPPRVSPSTRTISKEPFGFRCFVCLWITLVFACLGLQVEAAPVSLPLEVIGAQGTEVTATLTLSAAQGVPASAFGYKPITFAMPKRAASGSITGLGLRLTTPTPPCLTLARLMGASVDRLQSQSIDRLRSIELQIVQSEIASIYQVNLKNQKNAIKNYSQISV